MWILVIGTVNYSVLFFVPLLIIAKCCHRVLGNIWVTASLLACGCYMVLILNELTYEVCNKLKVEATLFNKIYHST